MTISNIQKIKEIEEVCGKDTHMSEMTLISAGLVSYEDNGATMTDKEFYAYVWGLEDGQ